MFVGAAMRSEATAAAEYKGESGQDLGRQEGTATALSLFLRLSIFVLLCFSVSLCFYASLSLSPCFYISVSLCLFLSLYLCLSVAPLSLYLSVSPFLSLYMQRGTESQAAVSTVSVPIVL